MVFQPSHPTGFFLCVPPDASLAFSSHRSYLTLPENGSVANYRLMWGTHSQAHQKSCIIKPSSTLSHLPQDIKTFWSPGVKKTPSS